MEAHSVVGYIRVSTEEQGRSGLGLISQRETIESECAHRRWDLVTVHQDVLSGKNMRRKGLAAALEMVESGSANVLMVAKLDRLSRSIKDFATLTERALVGGWSLVALDLGIDLSTPAGEMMANIMATMAQWERRIISQRTRDALAVKKTQGFELGRTDRIDPFLIARIVTMSAAGLGYSAIAHEFNEEGAPTAQGGKKWYPSTVRSALHRYHSPTFEKGTT